MIDPEDRCRALAAVDVSRETLERLDRYAELLLRWQTVKNLIGPKTIPTLWTRHIADSLQLVRLEPDALRWTDFGSGAGFPGLVVACALAGRDGAQVHLVESNGRKAAFLREAARVLDVPAIVHDRRVEDVVPGLVDIELVTARALAPLIDLLEMSALLLKSGARALFLKGQDVEVELTEASKSWTLDVSVTGSVTDPGGRIVRIASAAPRH
jgi:16S rRNA (guanine527-N7)-methyltransferase